MHLFPTTFSTDSKRSSSNSHRTTSLEADKKSLNVILAPSVSDKVLGTIVLGRSNAQITEMQFTSNTFHLTQDIKSIHTENKIHSLISTFHYTYFES